MSLNQVSLNEGYTVFKFKETNLVSIPAFGNVKMQDRRDELRSFALVKLQLSEQISQLDTDTTDQPMDWLNNSHTCRDDRQTTLPFHSIMPLPAVMSAL